MNESEIKIGDKVRLASLPPYLKTAEPMPMLRPSNLIKLEEEGIIIAKNPSNYYSVRFEKGTFLIDIEYLQSSSE